MMSHLSKIFMIMNNLHLNKPYGKRINATKEEEKKVEKSLPHRFYII